jgi:hypothetical protein
LLRRGERVLRGREVMRVEEVPGARGRILPVADRGTVAMQGVDMEVSSSNSHLEEVEAVIHMVLVLVRAMGGIRTELRKETNGAIDEIGLQ